MADRFIPLWSLPVTQKHSPPNHARAPQKWSFAGDSHLIEKRSGLLGLQAVVGRCEPPRLSNAPGCCTLRPQRQAGVQRCPPTPEVVCRGCHCSGPCSLPRWPGRDLPPLLASPARRVEPFHGLGLVWRESESMSLPSWCVSIFLMPFRSCQMGCSSLDPSFLSACSFSHLFVSRPEVFSPKQVHL